MPWTGLVVFTDTDGIERTGDGQSVVVSRSSVFLPSVKSVRTCFSRRGEAVTADVPFAAIREDLREAIAWWAGACR